jgi:plastocyanin
MKNMILIVVIVFVVGFGIYYYVSNNNYNNIAPANNSQTTPPVSNNTPASNPTSTVVTVSIKNFSFNPSTLTIKKGTTVTWVNDDVVAHTVTSDSGNLLASSPIPPGQSFSFTFVGSGTDNYHCSIHTTMHGSVIVE